MPEQAVGLWLPAQLEKMIDIIGFPRFIFFPNQPYPECIQQAYRY
jgi:hypothetical protein